MVTTHQAVAEVVSDKMLDHELSVKGLSDTTLIPRTTLVRRLAGESPFTITELYKIALVLGTTAVDLLAEAETKAGSAA